MKKILFVFSFSFILLLYGCSRELSDLLIENDIETLKSWSFQFNKGTNDYSLFFGLLNKSDEYISADVDVDIRIVNESDEEVYKGRKSVSKSDFSYYISKTKGEQYLANVRIPMTDIISGRSSDGKVFFTVYQSDICIFDEVNCSALSCLPIEDIQLTFDSLPKELKVKDYDGSTESIMQINDISYKFEKDYLPKLNITVSGEKIYGDSNSGYDIISYKLYDSSGNMIDSKDIFLDSLSKGDKFRDDSITIYDVIPGEEYTLQLLESDW